MGGPAVFSTTMSALKLLVASGTGVYTSAPRMEGARERTMATDNKVDFIDVILLNGVPLSFAVVWDGSVPTNCCSLLYPRTPLWQWEKCILYGTFVPRPRTHWAR